MTCTPFRIKQSFQDADICPFDASKIKLDMLGPSQQFQAPGTDAPPIANDDPQGCTGQIGSALMDAQPALEVWEGVGVACQMPGYFRALTSLLQPEKLEKWLDRLNI